jgi:lysophospholipase L1-like esterase
MLRLLTFTIICWRVSAQCGPGQTLKQIGNGQKSCVNNPVVATVTATSDPSAILMQKWRIALAKTRDAVSDAKILCIGDSTTFGAGSTADPPTPTVGSYPNRLAALFNSYYVPTVAGLAIPPSNQGGSDGRWVAGTGWSGAFNGVGWAGNAGWSANNPAGNLVFTPGGSVATDSYVIYYLQTASGSGQLTITATGGTPVVQATGGSPVGVRTINAVALASATTNTVTIAATNQVYVIGIEQFSSTSKNLRIGNAGVYGTNTTQWVTTDWYGPIAAITAYAPDLTIIMLGINDALTPLAIASYKVNITTLITTAQLSGDVILMTMPPSSGARATAEATYVQVLKDISIASNIPLIDNWARFNSTWQTLMMHDAVHPNNVGYWDIAGHLQAFLKRLQ